MNTFMCECGSKKFVVIRAEGLLVDFEREGAIAGHPFISKGAGIPKAWIPEPKVKCFECGATVPFKETELMLREVV